ncbi:hypothetical protein J3E69DRAFT_248692 [Trichoderma sp. SZMC 28015]
MRWQTAKVGRSFVQQLRTIPITNRDSDPGPKEAARCLVPHLVVLEPRFLSLVFARVFPPGISAILTVESRPQSAPGLHKQAVLLQAQESETLQIGWALLRKWRQGLVTLSSSTWTSRAPQPVLSPNCPYCCHGIPLNASGARERPEEKATALPVRCALCAMRGESTYCSSLASALLTRILCISGARKNLPCPLLMASSIT